MRRARRFSQEFSSNYSHVNPDKNELFMLKKCLEYLHKHLNRYRHFNKETLEFFCWVFGPEMKRVGELLIDQIQDKHREKFEEELFESEIDLDDWEYLITRMFRKIKPRDAKKIHQQILKLIGSLNLKIRYRGKSEIEKNMVNNDKTHFHKTTPTSFIERYCSKLGINKELTTVCFEFIFDKRKQS